MPKQIIARFQFENGYASDLPATQGGGFLRRGSSNAVVTGSGVVRPFRGLTQLQAKLAGNQHFLTDDTYAGLVSDGTASGSVIEALNLLFYIGQGRLLYGGSLVTNNGDPIDASTDLSYIIRDNNTFLNGDATHQYQVGHARPSAPSVYSKTTPSSGKTPMNAAVSVVIWRVDSNTGQPSLASPASVVVSLTNASLIVQFPAADTNGQDYWGIGVPLLGLRDLGNFYALPTTMGGEVAESTLAYTRTVTGASIPNSSFTVTITDPDTADQFTASDIGRRISFGTYDSYITAINSATECVCADENTSGSTISGTATVVQAVDGVTRAVEISWADTDLFGQTLAPFDAFQPPDGLFAGYLYDTFFVEAVDGTVFYSIPNYFSFPRSRKILTSDRAVCYIESGNSYHWRLAKQSISKLYYVGGLSPIQLDVVSPLLGCQFPSNACLGYGDRLLVWTGAPTIVNSDGSVNSEFHLPVELEFDGWQAQTEAEPVVVGYDPHTKYEVWIKGQTALAFHAPTGRWSAPIDLSDWLGASEKAVSTVIVNERLHIGTRDTTEVGPGTFDRLVSGVTATTVTNGSRVIVVGATALITAADIGKYAAVCDDTTGELLYGGEITAVVDGGGTTSVTLGNTPVYSGTGFTSVRVYIYDALADLRRLYTWDSGAGSIMTLHSYHEDCEASLATMSQLDSIVRPGSASTKFVYTVVKDFAHEVEAGTAIIAATPETHVAPCFRKNVRGIQTVAVKIVVSAENGTDPADGYAAVENITLYGEINKTFANVQT